LQRAELSMKNRANALYIMIGNREPSNGVELIRGAVTEIAYVIIPHSLTKIGYADWFKTHFVRVQPQCK
jgi:hypothetical protein